LDTELPRDRGVLVDVHLDELYLALGGTNRFLQHRCELLAWPAPFRPEVHQDRLAFGFLDYIFDEALSGRVLDHHGARPCRFAALQHRHLVRPSSAPPTPRRNLDMANYMVFKATFAINKLNPAATSLVPRPPRFGANGRSPPGTAAGRRAQSRSSWC